MFMNLRLSAASLRSGVFFFLLSLFAHAGEGECVFRWTRLFLDSVRQDSTTPAQVSRRLAILYSAARDAYELGNKPLLPSVPKPLNPQAIDPTCAAMGALFTGVELFYPSHKARYRKELETFLWEQKSYGLSAAKIKAGMTYGKEVVLTHLKDREGDGSSNKITFVPSDDPGKWRRTPPSYRPPELPHWGKVKPFLLQSAHQFRAPAPPARDSDAYRNAMNEVLTIGRKNSSGNDKEKGEETAQFWSCFSYTSTPSGHWNTILVDLLKKSKERKFVEILNAFAVLNVALADTAITCWETKYYYRFWRPETAIRFAEDESWKPLLESPPHPEYVSGHSSFAGAGAYILQKLFKTDEVSFEATSDSVPGVIRKYESFEKCAREMGQSRILGGIHFSFSNEAGLKLGKHVATYVWERFHQILDH